MSGNTTGSNWWQGIGAFIVLIIWIIVLLLVIFAPCYNRGDICREIILLILLYLLLLVGIGPLYSTLIIVLLIIAFVIQYKMKIGSF